MTHEKALNCHLSTASHTSRCVLNVLTMQCNDNHTIVTCNSSEWLSFEWALRVYQLFAASLCFCVVCTFFDVKTALFGLTVPHLVLKHFQMTFTVGYAPPIYTIQRHGRNRREHMETSLPCIRITHTRTTSVTSHNPIVIIIVCYRLIAPIKLCRVILVGRGLKFHRVNLHPFYSEKSSRD